MANMSSVINIYCDESCHLQHDRQRAMALGAISCPGNVHKRIGREIKALKKSHGIPPGRELKWTQVAPATLGFYSALADLHFNTPELGFRGVVVPDKQALEHERFQQSHDDFYYKMWWQLLTQLICDRHSYRIFVDIKDTHSAGRLAKLHDVLCSAHHDFAKERIVSIEAVRSHDVPLVQLADVLTGTLAHRFRGQQGSAAKQSLVARVCALSGSSLDKSTRMAARKFNLLVWRQS